MWRRIALAAGLVGCTPDALRAPSAPDPRPEPTETAATAVGLDPAGPREAELAGWPPLVVNEVLPGNDSILADERGQYDDWIELYNPTGADVDLTGWSIGDDPDPDWTFPAGTVIPAKGHLVVWADGQPRQGPLHATFSLGADEDTAWLFAPDESVVDSLTWPPLPDDVVYGRFPSGGPNRAASIVATPYNGNPADPGVSTDPTDVLFPRAGVFRVDLRVSQRDLDRLDENDRLTVEAGLGFEGAWLEPVGLSIKGGLGSRRDIDDKAAFRINLDEYVQGTRLRGMETLTLNNMVQDPSTVHEVLGYGLLREAGVPAPRVAHVELYLNGEYRGLYLHVETVDDQFLERWFPDDPYGNLYEGTYGVDLRPEDVQDFDLDEVGENDVTDRSELQALADFLAGPRTEAQMPEFERRVDLEEVLDAMAAEALMGHWDGYQYSANNYRIYHEPSIDQWSLVPSGLDQTFEDARGIWDGDAALIEFCLDIPSCRRRYDLKLGEMAARMLALDCRGRAEEVLARTSPFYEADPYRETSMEDHEAELRETYEWCSSWPRDVLGWL